MPPKKQPANSSGGITNNTPRVRAIEIIESTPSKEFQTFLANYLRSCTAPQAKSFCNLLQPLVKASAKSEVGTDSPGKNRGEKTHCLRCHQDYLVSANSTTSCRMPHDDDPEFEYSFFSQQHEYEAVYSCCGKSVPCSGDEAPLSSICWKGKHTSDPTDHALFWADSFEEEFEDIVGEEKDPSQMKMMWCESQGCESGREKPEGKKRKSQGNDSNLSKKSKTALQIG